MRRLAFLEIGGEEVLNDAGAEAATGFVMRRLIDDAGAAGGGGGISSGGLVRRRGLSVAGLEGREEGEAVVLVLLVRLLGARLRGSCRRTSPSVEAPEAGRPALIGRPPTFSDAAEDSGRTFGGVGRCEGSAEVVDVEPEFQGDVRRDTHGADDGAIDEDGALGDSFFRLPFRRESEEAPISRADVVVDDVAEASKFVEDT